MNRATSRHIEDYHAMEQYVGKEVYVVVGSEDEELSDIGIFETWGGLIEQLKTLTPTSDPETRIFHGILTSGEVIPSSFRGKSAYVICFDPYEESRGCVAESGSTGPDGLAEEIRNVMTLGGPISDMRICIDDIYILYGYQLDVCLSVNDEDIDEEIISTCREIADEIEIAGILA